MPFVLGILGRPKLIMLVVVAAIIGGLYFWNTLLKADLAVAQANIAVMEAALELQRDAVEAAQANAAEWREAFNGMQATIEELQDVQVAAAEESKRLSTIFIRHNLTTLAAARPGLVERRINSGSRAALSVLTSITSGDTQLSNRAGAATRTTGPPQPATDSN